MFEDQIVKVEGGRYYPDSKRATAYLIIYLKCRQCKDLNYIVELAKKAGTLPTDYFHGREVR